MNKQPNPNSQLDDDLWTEEERAEPAASQMDIAYAELFNSPDGEKVLRHLKSITLDQPCWVPGSDPSYGFHREGQNSIIRQIENRIRRVKDG